MTLRLTYDSEKTDIIDFRRKYADSPKILGMFDSDGFLLIMKGNYYYNVHRKFQVHSTDRYHQVATTSSTLNGYGMGQLLVLVLGKI